MAEQWYLENCKTCEGSERVFMIHEGVCLVCGGDTEVVLLAGTRKFMSSLGQGYHRSVTRSFYEENPNNAPDEGEVTYQCEQGHRNVVFHHYGDWS